MTDKRLDHIVRRVLPWRSPDSALTECGLVASEHPSLSREAMEDKIKQQGQQRAALSSCMTCWTAMNNEQRNADPTFSVMERECSRLRFTDRVNGQRLGRELRALGMLAAAHRDEFEAILRDMDEAVSLTDFKRRARR